MIKKLLLSIVVSALASMSLQARTINVHGVVTFANTGEPAAGVTVFNADINKFLGLTDSDGRYLVSIDSNGTLIFSGMSCQEVTVPVDDKLEHNVQMQIEANVLDEVVFTAQGNTKNLLTEPADLDIEGNYIRLKTKVAIPAKLFNSSMRMIIQPTIYNVTRKQLSYLKPIVYDGWRYADTQERMLDWNKSKDPLTPYQQIKRGGGPNTIYIVDSLYVDNPKDDFLCAIMTSLEDYNKIVYADTLEIARGTVNPLRFLNYSLSPLQVKEDKYLPTPEVELRDASGEMNLLFPVGKSNLDLSLGNNSSELEALLAEFKVIENDPNMTLKSFNIFGTASPEGSYEKNQELASNRMNSAMETVIQRIDPSIRRNAEIRSNAKVAGWDEVVTMLRADNYGYEADQVQNVINRYNDMNSRSIAMKRLPFYSMISEKYLPRLRRVNYNLVSSRYRPLTDEEIAELYRKNPNAMSKYQFYRHYKAVDGTHKEDVLRKAVKVHPDFVVAATDLSSLMLENNEDAMPVLEPFVKNKAQWSKLPEATRYNMALACMKSSRYSLADSLLNTIPESAETHKARIYATALNGRFPEVMEEVCADSPLNEVLLLLAIKDNHGAFRSSQKLGGSAVEEYVKAIAANRLDDYMSASAHLEKALKLDPSLLEIAKTDGDVLDLLDEDGAVHSNDAE